MGAIVATGSLVVATTIAAPAAASSEQHATGAHQLVVKRQLHGNYTRGKAGNLASPRDNGGEQWSLDNGQLDVDIASTGEFTTGSDGANGYQLLYGWPSSPGTGFTTAEVDGNDYLLSSAAEIDTPGAASADVPTNGDAYDQRSWDAGGVAVTQTITLVANQATGNADAMHVVWRMTNEDGLGHVASIRTLMDDDVNGSDGAVFHIPAYGEPTTETEFDGAAVPDRLTLYPSDSDTEHSASAFLSSGIDTRPDRLVIAHWPEAHQSVYDYTPDSTLSLGSDSAYLAYWENRSISAGVSTAVGTTYGVGHLVSDVRPPLDVTVDQQRTFTPVSATSIDHAYTPDPMTVGVSITNTSTTTVDPGVTVQLVLPAQLTSSNPLQPVGNIAPLDSTYLTFPLHAVAQPTAGAMTYTVRVSDANGYKDVPVTVQVPAATLVPLHYVALGDSYSAGEGTQASGFVDSNVSACNRTNAAYSNYLVRPGDSEPLATEARALFPGMDFDFEACTNAKIADIDNFDDPHDTGQNSNQPLQLGSVKSTTNLVTLTVGGNDVGFRNLIIACFAIPHCSGEADIHFSLFGHRFNATLAASTYDQIAKQQSRIQHLIGDIKKAAPTATVLIAGYPQIFPPVFDPRCGQAQLLEQAITPDELAFFRTATQKLNAVIAAAASASGAGYVDPTSNFDGHQLCGGGTDYFIGPIHSLTGGSSWTNSFHPTTDGQLAYAAAFDTWLSQNSGLPHNSAGLPIPTRVISATAAAPTSTGTGTDQGVAKGATSQVGVIVGNATVTATAASDSAACSSTSVGHGSALTIDADGYDPGRPVRIDLQDTGKTVTDIAPTAKADAFGHVHARITVPVAAAFTATAGIAVVGLAPGGKSLAADFGGFSVVRSGACLTTGNAVTGTVTLVSAATQVASVRIGGATVALRPGTARTLSLTPGKHVVALLGRKGKHTVTVSRRVVTVTAGVPALLKVTGAGSGHSLAPLAVPTAALTDRQAQVQIVTLGGSPLAVSLSAKASHATSLTVTPRHAAVHVWQAGQLLKTVPANLAARQRLVLIAVWVMGKVRVVAVKLAGQPTLT